MNLKRNKLVTEAQQVISGWNPRTGKKPTKEELSKARDVLAKEEEKNK